MTVSLIKKKKYLRYSYMYMEKKVVIGFFSFLDMLIFK